MSNRSQFDVELQHPQVHYDSAVLFINKSDKELIDKDIFLEVSLNLDPGLNCPSRSAITFVLDCEEHFIIEISNIPTDLAHVIYIRYVFVYVSMYLYV